MLKNFNKSHFFIKFKKNKNFTKVFLNCADINNGEVEIATDSWGRIRLRATFRSKN